MCLAVPGKVIAVRATDTEGFTTGTVDFQGSRLDVSLVFTPEARKGDWVLVHAGFALNVLPEEAALETWQYLQAENLEDVPCETKRHTREANP